MCILGESNSRQKERHKTGSGESMCSFITEKQGDDYDLGKQRRDR